MPLRNHYRVTKYDPVLRDASGAYTGDDWIMFEQIGQTFDGVPLTLATYLDVEARHLVALASVLEESGTSGPAGPEPQGMPSGPESAWIEPAAPLRGRRTRRAGRHSRRKRDLRR